MAEPLDLSVAIMCKDNEDTIRQTLDSIAPLASEIVAIDSGSTDRTMDILREYGARIEEHPWQGYIETCQIALELCTKSWVLAIDTDESIGAALAHSIRTALPTAQATTAGFRVNRKVWYRGRYLEHAWQPEWRLRIVRRSLIPEAIRSMGVEPHHRIDWVKPDPNMQLVDLQGDMRHDTIRNLASFLSGQIRLADQGAASMVAQGKRPSRMRIVTSPLGALLKQIVLKKAWRDGWRGWVAAGSAALATLAKYVILFDRANQSTAPTESPARPEYDAPTRSSPTSSTSGPSAGPYPSKTEQQ